MTDRSNLYTARRRKRRKTYVKPRTRAMISTICLAIVALSACAGLKTWFAEDRTRVSCPANELTRVVIPDETPEIMVDYEGFTVSFNPAHHQPNYVVWELTADEVNGTVARTSKFKSDPDVYGCATLDDYRKSGFDRGHMAPAADMKWSEQAMIDSHYLTNISPQDHLLNGGRWATLENKCREWAVRDSALIIICGPVLSDRMTRSIGRSKVSVPERFFKVILAPYTTPPRAIGFIMQNMGEKTDIYSSAVSVDEIETITGFDFFSALPDEIENEIEATANYAPWQRKKK